MEDIGIDTQIFQEFKENVKINVFSSNLIDFHRRVLGQLLGVLLADLREPEVNQLEQRVRAAVLVDLATVQSSGAEEDMEDVGIRFKGRWSTGERWWAASNEDRWAKEWRGCVPRTDRP